MTGWEVKFTDEFKEWLKQQSDNDKVVIAGRMFLLQEYGPNLARPYADTLKGSKIRNLKELRAKTDTHVFRIAFLFDEGQRAVILIGGDKKGKDEKRFYKNLINQAEQIYKQYIGKKGDGG
ncbi:toxin RelE [Spirochaetia bacterium]|nr:toxin RelE [Spirochaetia bacterium]